MNTLLFYSITGVSLFAIGLLGLIVTSHIMRKILSLNIIGVGIFMLLIALAKQNGESTDPLPHAMVLTGIVIAAAGTALALNLMIRLHDIKRANMRNLDDR